MKKVLVTGASGFIGRRLCLSLQETGVAVVALGRFFDKKLGDETLCLNLGYDTVQPEKLFGVDTIFHLAGKVHALVDYGEKDSEYNRVNVNGTRNLLEAACKANVRGFVFFSSVKAAGGNEICGSDETSASLPDNAYGFSKREAEDLVLHGGYVSHPVVLRLSLVYGPFLKGNLAQMIKAVSKNYFPPLPEVGNKRSMVHVDDVVKAALLAAESSKAAGRIFNLTDGNEYSTRQIYEWICEGLGKSVSKWHVPVGTLEVAARFCDGIEKIVNRRLAFNSDKLKKLIGSACYSSKKIRHELGFVPDKNLHDSLPEIIHSLGLGSK